MSETRRRATADVVNLAGIGGGRSARDGAALPGTLAGTSSVDVLLRSVTYMSARCGAT